MSKRYDWLPQWDLQQDLNGITENAVFPEYLEEGKYQPRTLIDETLETIDPTPNVHTMFVQFNEKFFWNKLLPVQVRWSQRMTTCAGTCSFHPRNRECIIALSAPLLKLRPRKDLVETLLHEMIHGYLFLTNNNRDRDGHGPEFCKHMNRINKDAGTNITIYHSFHDEVRLYQQHWWRCNGPCQNRAPYFGTVRRAMNRAPGPSDYWFKSHRMNCGGEFIKVREPESKEKVKSKNKTLIKSPEQNNTMDRYVTSDHSKNSSPKIIMKPPSSTSNVSKIGSGINKINGLGTGDTDKSSKSIPNKCPCSGSTKNSPGSFTKLGSGINNVYGFGTGGPGSSTSKQRSNESTSKSKSPGKVKFTGVVGGNASGRSNLLDKFSSSPARQIPKKTQILDNNSVQCPVCSINFSHELINSHIDICLLKGNDEEHPPAKRPKISSANNDNNRSNTNDSSDNRNVHMCPICLKKFPDDVINIHVEECLLKQNVADSTSSRTDQSTERSRENNSNDPAATATFRECPICSEFFTEDEIFNHVNTCLADGESNNTNAVIDLRASPIDDKTDKNNIRCPTCSQDIRLVDYIIHVEKCLATEYSNANNKNSIVIVDDDIFKPGSSKQNADTSDKYKCLVCDAMISKSIPLNEHLDYCVSITYRDTTIAETSIADKLPTVTIDDDNSEEEEEEEEKHLCPICMKMIKESLMAQHVDDCITSIH